MKLGIVIGQVWATRKLNDLQGFKLMMVKDVSPKGMVLRCYTVAADIPEAASGIPSF